MPPKKLSDSDKQEILKLYRQPQETTSTLASRYGVSNSTISRILKQSLSDDDYEMLVQQKRTGIFKETEVEPETQVEPPILKTELPDVSEDEDETDADEADAFTPSLNETRSNTTMPEAPKRRRRRRSSVAAEEHDALADESSQSVDGGDREPADFSEVSWSNQNGDKYEEPDEADKEGVFADVLHEDLLNPEEDFSDLSDELDDDEDEDEDEDDLDDEYDDDDDDFDRFDLAEFSGAHLRGKTFVSILPFSDAALPKTCYLVVDRSAELITRPLKDFAELGQIPDDEIQARTLPIFDNHRVARRFSNRRTQRVVKIPDGKMLQKTSPYLQAKGITRLLIDGQIYAIETSES
jgi:transposase-like protein